MTHTESDPTSTATDDPADPLESERQAVAALYEFCAGVLADPPGKLAVEGIVTAGVPDPEVMVNERLRRGFELLERWRTDVDDPEEAVCELERTHTRLFVGPRPRLQIHESYYAGDFLGRPLARVQGTYAGLGIAPADDLREEADHAAVELSALALLTRREVEDPDAKRLFLREHGWWISEFAADVEEVTDCRFYRGIAAIADGLVQFDANRFEVAFESPAVPQSTANVRS